MRAIGMAERALRLMCERVQQRVAFGQPLADQGTIQADIAEARLAIEQTRLLTLKTAWLIDTVGVKGARIEISAIKVAAARLATRDRSRSRRRCAGVNDWPLRRCTARATLHIVDGPMRFTCSRSARRSRAATSRSARSTA
jgi:acyl-CoA dehydrogenase